MSLVTEIMNSYIADIQDKLVKKGRPVIAEMFKATYLNTIDTTVKMDEHGRVCYHRRYSRYVAP